MKNRSAIAVVGYGYWGKNLARNFAELGALRVVCDTDPARLASLREVLPQVQATSSFAEILKDNSLGAVILATPASSHFRLAMEALLAGKDVFVEKPLALKVSEGRKLVELAGEKSSVLMVGHLLRYHPAVVTLKGLIDEGKLGKILYIYSNRLNLGRFRTEENILWSFAPHDISAILYLLGEQPSRIFAQGGTYLNDGIPDVTVTTLEFRNGVRGHIFVSWLHPYKEQKLIVVGNRRMAVFNDMEPERKLLLLNHSVEWVERMPVPRSEETEAIEFSWREPLRLECEHFLECVATRRKPDTDGEEGLRVLEILEACQESLNQDGAVISLSADSPRRYFAHETAIVEEPCDIGEETKIWHFSHIMRSVKIGKNCILGQNVHVGPNVIIGDRCKIQNNVSLYDGVVLENDVFCGPSMVFTNVINPRSAISRKAEFRTTLVRTGATIGANATVLCGHTIGRYAFVGAGAVVTKDVPDYALVYGNPARIQGWMCQCGIKLNFARKGAEERAICECCGVEYAKRGEVARPIGTEKV